MKPRKYKSIVTIPLLVFSIAAILFSCDEIKQNKEDTKIATITVTATAYNSVEHQTKKGSFGLAAWGDILEDGEHAIAVSHDLIKMGLDHNEEVEIDGLEGIYVVKDKMNKRWKRKIDIYMGLNEKAAQKWGKQEVEIRFNKKDRLHDKFSEQTR